MNSKENKQPSAINWHLQVNQWAVISELHILRPTVRWTLWTRVMTSSAFSSSLLTSFVGFFFFCCLCSWHWKGPCFLKKEQKQCVLLTSCCCTLANAQTAEINELHDSLCLLSFYILHSFCHSSASSLPRDQNIKVLGGREGKRALCNHRMCPFQFQWEGFSGRSLLCCQ